MHGPGVSNGTLSAHGPGVFDGTLSAHGPGVSEGALSAHGPGVSDGTLSAHAPSFGGLRKVSTASAELAHSYRTVSCVDLNR